MPPTFACSSADFHSNPLRVLSTPWQVWVDTGGTFTDCIGVAPDGSVRRAKVLSSSRLRGSVVEQLDARSLRVDARWAGHPGIVEGLEVRFGRSDDDSPARRHPVHGKGVDPVAGHINRVVHFDPAGGLLTVSHPLPILRPGDALEIQSPEEAPVLAARIITGT